MRLTLTLELLTSDAGNGVPKTKYDVKATTQCASSESKIAIMERELDTDDATHQDILKYEQRMSAIESLLDTNLTEVYTSWMETVDDAVASGIRNNLKLTLNEFNDRMRRMRYSLRRLTSRETPSPVPAAVPIPTPAPRLRNTFEKRPIPKFSGDSRDYSRFKSRWKEVIKEFNEESQLDYIINQVPVKVKTKIKMCWTIKAVWEKLDDDFGHPEEIAARCLKTLMEWSIPARNEHVAFITLYDMFVEVQHDLQEVNQEHLLSVFLVIESVVNKLP